MLLLARTALCAVICHRLASPVSPFITPEPQRQRTQLSSIQVAESATDAKRSFDEGDKPRIVLVAGFESFNRDLYEKAASEVGVTLAVFADSDVRSDKTGAVTPNFEEAMKSADAFIGSLVFDYDDGEVFSLTAWNIHAFLLMSLPMFSTRSPRRKEIRRICRRPSFYLRVCYRTHDREQSWLVLNGRKRRIGSTSSSQKSPIHVLLWKGRGQDQRISEIPENWPHPPEVHTRWQSEGSPHLVGNLSLLESRRQAERPEHVTSHFRDVQEQGRPGDGPEAARAAGHSGRGVDPSAERGYEVHRIASCLSRLAFVSVYL